MPDFATISQEELDRITDWRPSHTMPDIDEAELTKRFDYHAPVGDKAERHERTRAAARAFAECIIECTPTSREQSLALTATEEAMMWANAAIARNE